MSYHTIVIVGHLGKDPEMRYLPDGRPVASFSVAVSDGFGERKSTIWFRVSVFDKQAESCNQYLSKGKQVLCEGRLQHDTNGSPRVFTRKDGTAGASFEMVAQTVRFLTSRSESGGGEYGGGEAVGGSEDAGDIPF